MNGWFYDSESEIVKPIWYDGQPFPPSMRKLTKGKRNMENADGYEADKERLFRTPKNKVKQNKDISYYINLLPNKHYIHHYKFVFTKKLKYSWKFNRWMIKVNGSVYQIF